MTETPFPSLTGGRALRLAATILAHRRIILWSALSVTATVVAIVLLRPRVYEASSTFIPQESNAPVPLAGLASQFGVSVPLQGGGQSPAFYVELLWSRPILSRVVDTVFRIDDAGGGSREVRLVDLYGGDAATHALRREAALERLRQTVTPNVSTSTALVKVRVRAPFADLAQQLNVLLLDLVNEFNVATRQSQAAAERRFAEQRLEEVEADLREAEDRLLAFIQRNRAYDSPELQFERERLARDVSLESQRHLILAQGYERARLEEVRDLPVITVVEPPPLPVRPSSRPWVLGMLIGVLLGGGIGIVIALVHQGWRRLREDGPPGAERLLDEWRATVADLRLPWRLLGSRRADSRASGL